MPRLEKELATQFRERLEVYIHHGMIAWGQRLNSGSPYILGKGKIVMCPVGTFDWITIILREQNGLLVVFWELKSDDRYNKFWTSKEQWEVEQRKFYKKYNSIEGFKAFVIKDIEVFDNFINQNAIDKTKDLPSDLKDIK